MRVISSVWEMYRLTTNVDQKVSVATTLQEDTKRRNEDGQDDLWGWVEEKKYKYKREGQYTLRISEAVKAIVNCELGVVGVVVR